MPEVIAIVPTAGGDEVARWSADNAICFPVKELGMGRYSQLISFAPAAAWVENGTIMDVWVGRMPIDFIDRLRQSLAASRLDAYTAGDIKQPM